MYVLPRDPLFPGHHYQGVLGVQFDLSFHRIHFLYRRKRMKQPTSDLHLWRVQLDINKFGFQVDEGWNVSMIHFQNRLSVYLTNYFQF